LLEAVERRRIEPLCKTPQRTQSRPQPATFDTDLDDDVPF
jgi:hypothetical protein